MGFIQEMSRNLSKLLTAAKQDPPTRTREEPAPETMRQEPPCATDSRDRNDHGGDDHCVHRFDHHSDRCRGKNNGHPLFPVSIRYIAAALTAAMLFTALPAAAATPDEQSSPNAAESSAADSAYTVAPAEEAYAVSEITSMRGMNEKRFLMSDKSTMAVVYSQPVHYQNNGKWEDIDNTLVYESANIICAIPTACIAIKTVRVY